MTVTDGRGRPIPAGGLARWLATVAPARVRGEVAIALVSDQRIRQLNRAYRRKDRVTDVLSFAAEPDPEPRAPNSEPRFLGDIVIASGVARRQAREARHSYSTELRVLALHGLLHLLGYDHDDRGDRGRMARLEARLRRKGRLREGLIGRAGSGRRSGERLRPASAKRAGVGPRLGQRLRPARAAGGKRGAATPASAKRAGVGPRSHKKR